jgi:hypothetical protein
MTMGDMTEEELEERATEFARVHNDPRTDQKMKEYNLRDWARFCEVHGKPLPTQATTQVWPR